MARTVAELPKGARITDYISLGVLTKTFPLDKVKAVVAGAGKTNRDNGICPRTWLCITSSR